MNSVQTCELPTDLPADLRLLLVHKQSTSARVRFLRFGHGLLAFTPLPALSVVDEAAAAPSLMHHPASFLRIAEQRLGLPGGSLELEPEFLAQVDTPDGAVTVHLARFTSIDPPFDAADAAGGRFIAITEARGGTPAEMELLRLGACRTFPSALA